MVDFFSPRVGLLFPDFSDFSYNQSLLQIIVTSFFFCLVKRTTRYSKHPAKCLDSCGRVGGEQLVYCLEPDFFLMEILSSLSPTSISFSNASARSFWYSSSLRSSRFLRSDSSSFCAADFFGLPMVRGLYFLRMC